MYFTDTQQINKKAYEALKRIRDNKRKEEQNLVLENSNFNKKAKYNTVIPDYSDKKFQEKVELDQYIYDKLFEGLKLDEKEAVSALITEMLTDVKDIYKFINIEPKTIGFKNMTPVDSKSSLVTEASNIINNFLNKEYYSLTKEEKSKKYKDSVINLAHNIVLEEGISSEEAIEHSYKTIIMQSLLENINFPFIIKHKLNEVFEDDIYNDFFDIDQLYNLRESFNLKVKNIARVASVLVK